MGDFTFAQVPQVQIPRSVFNRSHRHKTTFDSGYLVPFYVDEALPGDTFTVRVGALARLATPIVPVMDNLYLDFFFFAVPNRLVWDTWQRFMGERPNPTDSIDFLVPQVSSPGGGFAIGGLHDYFGVPTGVQLGGAGGAAVSALFARSYNLIWNEWFRDENLQTRVPVSKTNGPDASGDYVLKKRGKRHDYFTSCLPWPQKSTTAVSVPLGTSAMLKTKAFHDGYTQHDTGVPVFQRTSGGTPTGNPGAFQNPAGTTVIWGGGAGAGELRFFQDAGTGEAMAGLYADLSTATAATINQLREAFQIQKLLERDARGGTRYIELLKAHFGVTSPDARVQRPEYLGGGSLPVNINPVTKTSSTDGTSPQGFLAGYGLAAGGGIGFTKSFTEHCVLMGLMSVRADLTYQQGLPRMFSRRTRYDFYWPAFAHLGEQAVLNKEIYASGVPATDDGVFGYQERWAEYRYGHSKITGKFRSADAGSLDVWHLSQNFTALPTLGSTFIEESPPINRVVAVPTEPQFLFDSYIQVKAARPMPTYSVPGMIDRF